MTGGAGGAASGAAADAGVTAGWQAVSTAAASSEAVAMKATRRVGDGIDPRRERKAGMGGLLE
jgi:hypothetical protein